MENRTLKYANVYSNFKPLKLLPPFLESPRQRPCTSGQGPSVRMKKSGRDHQVKNISSDEIMREQFVKSGEWKLTNSKIEKSLEVFNKYQTGSNSKNNTQYSGKCFIYNLD